MEKVMVFGTFDILHLGHLDYFKQAKKWGDYLVVVVARDKNVLKSKGKKPKYNEKVRLGKIKKVKMVDKVVLGYVRDRFKMIEKMNPDTVCFGYDQKVDLDLMKKIKKQKIKIRRLKSYKPRKYKSSLL
ncbi:adenylyltransferase/cytidyltransferase family protein [Nanoarchaeota archaeon]